MRLRVLPAFVASGALACTGTSGLSSGGAPRSDASTEASAEASTDASAPIDAGDADAASPGGYRDLVMADEPIAYWRLAETSGTTAKDETGQHDGAWVGSPQLGQPGPFGAGSLAAGMRGQEHVEANSLSFVTFLAMTLEAWVAPDNAASNEYTIMEFASLDGNSSPELFIDGATGAFKLFSHGASLVTGTVPVKGRWYHVVWTWDGSAAGTVYLDGQVAANGNVQDGTPYQGRFVIGVDYDPLGDGGVLLNSWFAGLVAEVAVYGKVLAADRIAAHHAWKAP